MPGNYPVRPPQAQPRAQHQSQHNQHPRQDGRCGANLPIAWGLLEPDDISPTTTKASTPSSTGRTISTTATRNR